MSWRRADHEISSVAEALFAASADAAIIGTPEGAVLRANPAACAMLGRTEEELQRLGRAGILVTDAHVDALIAERDAASRVRGEVQLRRADGSTVPVEACATIVAVQDGALELVVLRDVSEQHRRARELRDAEEHARAQVAELEALYATAPIGLCVFDPQLRWVRLNQRLADIDGLPLEDHLGRTPRELEPTLAASGEPALRTILETGEPLESEMRGETRSSPGVERCWRTWGAPIRDAQGRVSGVTVAVEEITGRKHAEEALRDSEERFRTLADNISQLAWMTDASGSICWYNRRWYEYTGETLEEMSGWGWTKVHHPDHVARVVEKIARCFERGEPWEDTFPLRGRDGAYRWFLSRAIPIRDALGVVRRWFGTNTDVTELREAQQALREADQRKTEFLAVLSHELRNLLAPIRNALYLLDRAPAESASSERARGAMHRQIDHLTRLVGDLLDVSRVGYGKVHLERTRLDARDVVRRACEDARATFEGLGVSLTVELAPEPLWVEADGTRVAQVVTNVLGNAAKFTPPGGTVAATVQRSTGAVEIRVRDTGAGIDPRLLQRIFEPFAQGDATGAAARGGLGIGLALVKNLVELHGGSVRAESDGPGTGAEIIVTLPLAALDEADGAPRTALSTACQHLGADHHTPA